MDVRWIAVEANKFEHGCTMIFAGLLPFFGWGLGDGHVPTFWLLQFTVLEAELFRHTVDRKC